jgi:hypothetical protein
MEANGTSLDIGFPDPALGASTRDRAAASACRFAMLCRRPSAASRQRSQHQVLSSDERTVTTSWLSMPTKLGNA